MLKIKGYKEITLIALIISIIVLLILAGVTINAISGSESAPAKANEAGQKNDIGAAKDDISLTVVNAKMQGMETAYVGNGVSAGDASTTVGTEVIKAVAKKYQTNNQFGKATIEIDGFGTINNVERNATVSVYTTDFVIEGTITLNDGVLTWGEIEPNVPRIVGMPSTYELNTNSSFTIQASLKGTTGIIHWESSDEDIATVIDGIVTTASSIENQTAEVIITASATGCEDKICTLTVTKVLTAKDILTINPSATTAEEKSPYVIYKAGKNIDDTTNGETNEILCRVLYNDDTHGLQLISVNPVTDVTLGANDPNYVTASSTDLEEAQNSYNHAITNLNNKAEEYLANDGIAIDARCVGSLATISSATKKFDKKDNPEDLVVDIDNPTNEEKNSYMFTADSSFTYMNDYNGKYYNGDTNYTEDANRLKTSGGIDANKITKKANGSSENLSSYFYWVASHRVESYDSGTYFFIRNYNSGGYMSSNQLLQLDSNNSTWSIERNFGLRPVFLLKSNTKISGGSGTESDPYTLHVGN